MTDPTSKPFDHPENICVGLAKVIYGTNGYSWAQVSGWFLPEKRFTTSREEAHACATEMNRLMGGVQVVREVDHG